MAYAGEDRRRHCDNHDDLQQVLTTLDTNVEWIKSTLKLALSAFGTIFVVIVIPTAVWISNLDKRVTNLETRLALHITPEPKK